VARSFKKFKTIVFTMSHLSEKDYRNKAIVLNFLKLLELLETPKS